MSEEANDMTSGVKDSVPAEEKVQKKLESLTPEQEAMIPVFRDKWLNLFYNNEGINQELATKQIQWLYTFCGKEQPEVMFMDSPLGCQILIQKLKDGEDVKPSDINIETQKDFTAKDFFPSSYYANTSDYGWVAFYDFFQSLEFFDYDWTNFNEFKALLQSGIYELYTFEKVCIACSIPKVKQDEQNRLHYEDGYAVVFKDGFSMTYWHGVNVPERWIFNPETITKEEIIKEDNAERRRVMKEILGSKNFAERLGIEVIDEDIDQKKNPVKLYRSSEKDSTINEYLYFANVICPSTEREYFISIDPEVGAKGNVWQAVAWTFSMNEQEYKPNEET